MTAISFLLAALAGACSIANPSHCANLDGNATCAELDPGAPYCNRCVAANDGCVAEPADDDICDAGSTSLPGTSTTAPTSSTSSTSDPSTAADTTTGDPSTSDPVATLLTTSTTDPDPVTTTTSTTTATTTTGTETSSSTDTGSTTTAETETTTAEATDTTETTSETEPDSGDTLPIPICGDDVAEGWETCDGADLNGQTCASKNPTKYGGGILECHFTCLAYVEDNCCLVNGEACGLGGSGQSCCPGLNCVLLGGSLFGCQ